MSDFVPRDILPDLWEEILSRHWTYLETEENMQKLEERKKLDGCLKEFLCVVPHDRKFFLPETAHVLRKTVREMDDFTAYKAIVGFDSISQYANNLFTKPWRKEYRVIKMYSGYFTHEVKSNLLDAVRLFEAMGYRQVSSEILMLDGPICPDQVTNVSRDAMLAYVECQIMKQIYAGVQALGVDCSWQDVFHYREKQVGGSSQAIKGLAYALQERRYGKEKQQKSENIYATIQHSNTPQQQNTLQRGVQPPMPQCQNCATCHQQLTQQAPLAPPPPAPSLIPSSQCAVHSNNNNNSSNININHPNYALHTNNNNNNNAIATQSAHGMTYSGNSSKLIASYPAAAAASYQQHSFVAPGGTQAQQSSQTAAHMMSHSRSLEHYNEPQPPPLPHRHSFDHQQQGCMAHQYQSASHYYQVPSNPQPPPPQHIYESPYDCIDGLSLGSSSAGPSYAAVASNNCNYGAHPAYAHPYNVSGNRYPLPYNISSQLNSHYATPANICNGAAGGGGGVAGAQPLDLHYMANYDEVPAVALSKMHSCNYHGQPEASPLPPARHHYATTKDFQACRQRSFPPDQHHLIDFDDRAHLTDHDFHAQLQTRLHHNNSFDYEREHEERCRQMAEHQVQRATADRRSKSATVTALTGGVNRLALNSTYAQPKDALGQQRQSRYATEQLSSSTDNVGGDNYIYARPRSKVRDNQGMSGGGVVGSSFPERYAREGAVGKMTDKYLRNAEHKQEIYNDNNRSSDRSHLMNGKSKYATVAGAQISGDTSENGYDSVDDFINVGSSEYAAGITTTSTQQRSPTQAIKNQDGVGSFETWDYVFQNLEQSGYSKDLGERGDLLVQSLDLDSHLPLSAGAGANGSIEKRRSSHNDGGKSRQVNGGGGGGGGDKSRTLEKAHTAPETASAKSAGKSGAVKQEKSILKTSSSKSNGGSGGSGGGVRSLSSGTTKIKSALKSTLTTTLPGINGKNNNNNNNNGDYVQQQQRGKTSPKSKTQNANANRSALKQPPPVATQVIITSPNEWSCRFCTFLNPDTKRICEMCARSKDFNPDGIVSNTPTCV